MLKTQKENLTQRMNFGHTGKHSALSRTSYQNKLQLKSNISEDVASLKVSTFQSESKSKLKASKSTSKNSAQIMAAVYIQSSVRGYLVRLRMKRLLRLRRSIRTIQAWFRGYIERRKLA